MSQNLAHYTPAYYQRDCAEFWYPRAGQLRPDQLAALAYIHSVPFFGDEPWHVPGQHWPRRRPQRVMSIGCGEGHLEAALERLGITVLGVDPSPGARALYQGSTLRDDIDGIEDVDTVIFCESLEHLPRPVIDEVWSRLPLRDVRVVITNWPSYHPLHPSGDGWDHITKLDDAFYDELAQGFTVVWRHRSHLVLDR